MTIAETINLTVNRLSPDQQEKALEFVKLLAAEGDVGLPRRAPWGTLKEQIADISLEEL